MRKPSIDHEGSIDKITMIIDMRRPTCRFKMTTTEIPGLHMTLGQVIGYNIFVRLGLKLMSRGTRWTSVICHDSGCIQNGTDGTERGT